MAGQSNINFHQTFKPERQYISSILNVADGLTSMSIKDISASTGIPQGASSGKVEPHISYAKFMGLIDADKKGGEYILTRTTLGETVYMEDPGIQEDISILLCHCMMLRDKGGAIVWKSVFKKLLPKYHREIRKNILLKELEQCIEGNITQKNFAPFIGSYEDMFNSLGILDTTSEMLSLGTVTYDKEYIYLYAYVLFEYWDELFNGQDEISSEQFVQLGFGSAFGWNEQEEYAVLEHLTDKGIIRMNRQLMPYTILKLTNKDILCKRLYSELC